MLRAVIYARFSSDMQREESIDAQVRACTIAKQKVTLLLANTPTKPKAAAS